MKKIAFTLFILAFASLFGANASYASSCDYTEYNQLRYGHKYSFSDTFTNNERSNQIALSKFNAVFSPKYDYNGSKSEPTFKWTNNIVSDKYHIKPWEKDVDIIVSEKPDYEINYHPPVRKSDNLLITYDVEYYKKSGSTYVWPTKHKECAYYEITWCWDGQKDSAYEQCDPNDMTQLGWGNGGCSQTCKAITLTPKINLIKTDNNQNDKDGNIGNDTQTINYNSTATFLLTVKNNGNEDLKDIRIEDPKTSSCAGNIDMKKYGNKNDILEVNESFQITCSKNNVLEDFTNTATVYGIWITSNDWVDSQDNTKVIIDTSTIPSAIKIDKIDANPDDLDKVQGNDSQKVSEWKKAIFKIKITNIGSDDLINLSTLDPMTGNCEIQLSELKRWDANAHIYTCEHENVWEDFTNTISVKATGKVSGNEVKDSDDTQIILDDDGTGVSATCDSLEVTPNMWPAPLNFQVNCNVSNATSYKINLVDDSGNIINTTDNQSANFTISNQWNYNVSCYIDGKNTTPDVCSQWVIVGENSWPSISIDKIDANPNDLDTEIWNDTQTVLYNSGAIFDITVTNNGTKDLVNVEITDAQSPTCDMILDLNTIWNADGLFNPGESHTYTCDDSNIITNYTNTAVVTANPIDDLNSEVTDEDSTDIIVDNWSLPVCNNLSLSQNYGRSAYTSTFTCSWVNATSYKVELTRPDGTKDTFNTSTGEFNINSRWDYTATCYIQDDITSTACRKTLSYTTWWGSSSPYCRNIDVSSDSVKCSWNKSDSFKLDCGNGNYPMNSNGTFLRESCNEWFLETDSGYISDFKNQDLRCYSSYKDGLIDQWDSSWESRAACYYDEGDSDWGGWKWGYCGDWAVQRPNSKGQMEQCEPGQLGCNSNCTLDITTYPSNWDLDVYAPDEKYIIWNNMDLYTSHSVDKPYIVNNSNSDYDNDYYIDQICAVRKNWNSIVWNPQCSPVGLLIPGQRVNFSWNISFVWDTSSLTQSSDDNTIAYTVKHGWQTYEWSTSLTDTFEVTVKKPTVVTTGWWTAYVWNTSGLSDNNDWNWNTWIQDTNITGTSVWGLSSGVKETSESDSSVWEDKDSVDEDSGILNATNAKDAEFVNYNGLENVYYYRWDLVVSDASNLLDYTTDENKTYIVEGNLIINTNINSHNANLGFIVIWENNNLSIHKWVKELKWTFINVKWNVIWTWGYTTDQIIIKGSMYGKMNKLLEKRTYIKNNNWVIDVGTIVSFGSSVFRKPAPLTSKFIWDYLEAQKTAK